jgi:hypothetical protein
MHCVSNCNLSFSILSLKGGTQLLSDTTVGELNSFQMRPSSSKDIGQLV